MDRCIQSQFRMANAQATHPPQSRWQKYCVIKEHEIDNTTRAEKKSIKGRIDTSIMAKGNPRNISPDLRSGHSGRKNRTRP